jgi:hypothetical protein
MTSPFPSSTRSLAAEDTEPLNGLVVVDLTRARREAGLAGHLKVGYWTISVPRAHPGSRQPPWECS